MEKRKGTPLQIGLKEKIDDVEWVIQLLVENKSLKQKIKQKGLL